jgi:hypothetical protein
MQTIPISAVAAQTISVTLDSQPCRINIYQKTFYTAGETAGNYIPNYRVYLDLYVDNLLVIGGCLCLNLVRIVRDSYFGFVGDLLFFDTQGSDDPVASGLGARFQLVYLEASDLTEASV